MAQPEVDISTLTEDQQLALQQYTSVTDQDLASAVPLLQKCQWNAQIAITRFFDGDAEIIDPVAEAAAQPPPVARRAENLQDSLDASVFSRPSAGSSRFTPAPRVVAVPESQQTQRLPLVLTLILAPFRASYSLLSTLLSTLGWAFPILPRLLARLPRLGPAAGAGARKPLNPRDTAARFIRSFEEEYGSTPGALPWEESGYATAYDTAKKELRYLVVVLLSPEHDDTPSFCRETLLDPAVTEFFAQKKQDNLLWGGSVRDAEAYQVATALRVTKFPFVGMVVHTPSAGSTSMSLVCRVAGPTPPGEMVAKLEAAIREREGELSGVRARRREDNAARSILQEQNSAYERSLATDRQRARRRREEEEERERVEREEDERVRVREERAKKVGQWRRWRKAQLHEEPGQGDGEVVRVSIRMSNGERLVRRFVGGDGIEELYAFVECHDSEEEVETEKEAVKPTGYEHEYGFRLVSPMPREVYDMDTGGTIRERIGRSGNLIVEKTNMEDDEEDEDAA